ncbi:DNA mismatch repair protein MutS [Candidatus Falkowbacteria bacterium RIFOXYA2_FULL_35_8]|uniref:DNA mismatch repair protein MutS n=1 Tax=Candidatus Falkowbacteria bacterium RIFOXYC2_FULL_36_12 TaxID=1798002 RepID=A0A1F5SZ42_9BACT|nr:MAG: DNA mismatch repair protein MutS [Candidatus Falkowbacteria bacterium RIFOXYB2_FULL_35_7]OGF31723.1 MAG: DNA mismatch repair protein MutS [Candidatus Falkowbacteria bacterium RIFOXYC2_FULL_36_12]OGF33651.1 MAG: DNA mismatch repair protein MutS [Candidatus Falkowbacteria bacterium RIFOXYA2_FULL_35_8]
MPTPMFQQYYEIKQKYPKDILFFRMGDFYEMFGEDAREASGILNITLTKRAKGTENETPMCGIPYHAAENYIAKLTKVGKRVAICEQISDPSLPGIVKREVVRVVTPGTTMNDSVLDNRQNNYLVSLSLQKNTWGFAVCDLTIGDFQATEILNLEVVKNELARLKPSEIIVTPELINDSRLTEFIAGLKNLNVYKLPAFEKADRSLVEQFKVKNLSSFGLNELPVAIESAGNLLGYLKETQKTALDHILTMKRYAIENFMTLDQATIRNLELLQNNWTFSTDGSLLQVVDQTITAMGGRALRRSLLLPFINLNQITDRLNAVEELVNTVPIAIKIIESLKQMSDFERLVGKIGCGRANARDLVALKHSLKLINPLKLLLVELQQQKFTDINSNLVSHESVIKLIEETLVDEPPITLNQGQMIKDGYNAELDQLRQISRGGKDWILEMQAQEIKNTGISSLKVKYNKVFGYYIEISNTKLNAVPENYIRKQTLVNAERFITPELKEYEEKVLGAEDKISHIEYQIFQELREKVVKYFAEIQNSARQIAELDLVLGFFILARANDYCKPVVNANGRIIIKDGRHPVIERLADRYVSNDTEFDHEKNEMILLTGPNMSGKSSYLRQVALITLLAQTGSFVPARSAEIGLVDRIFTRVGASDNLSQGVSTFMNEMQEAANIINNATERSLIVLDEIGRGTSTFDGVSIAWSIVEYIHNQIRAKTLFATHYHELVDIVAKLPRAENYCVAVSENQGKVVFLHKIIRGATSDSYGIEVAKLAGLPDKIIDRAEEVLRELEAKSNLTITKPVQKSLEFSPREERLAKELMKIDPNAITPIEALQKIEQLKKNIDKN